MKVLLLIADALHLGFLGCYGNPWTATPNLDRLAAEGVVFDQHYADCPRRSAVWLASTTGQFALPLPADLPHVARLARCQRGLRNLRRHLGPGTETTPGIVRLSPDSDIAREIKFLANRDSFLQIMRMPSLQPPWMVDDELFAHYAELQAADSTDEEEEPKPLLPVADPSNGPIDPNDDALLDRLQLSYAAVVTAIDELVGEVLDQLEDKELLNETVVIFTAGRGFCLGEHGHVGLCRPWLHDEIVHLPLTVRLPHLAEGSRRVSGLTQPADLFPTLLEAMARPVSASYGRSLYPLLRGDEALFRPFAISGWLRGSEGEWALRTPEWCYLWPQGGDGSRGPQLYRKPEDRWEVNNVIHHNPELAEELESKLRDCLTAIAKGTDPCQR